MNIRIAFIILSLFPAFGLFASEPSQTVRGRVFDRQTLLTLPGANVIIQGTNPVIGATSDINGEFEIRNVPLGRIDIQISFMGYRKVVLNNINHIAGKETVLQIAMEETVIQTDEILISAHADKAEPVNPMATVSVRGFTVEETERFAGSRNDVARMASNYAGVVGNSDDRNDIVVRGNSPTGLLWRLEGIDIPSPNHWAAFGSSGGPVNMLNHNLLANSDFYSGAFPAEYGNATASVFDLKMRNGNNRKHEFLGQIGFNGFEIGAEGPVFKKYGGSYIVNARYSTMEIFNKIGMDFGTIGVPKYKDMSFKFNLPSTKLGSFSVFGLGGLSKIEMLDKHRKDDSNDVDYYSGEGFDLINGADLGVAGMNHVARINNNTFLRSTLAFSHRNVKTDIDSLVLPDMTPFRIYGNYFSENRLSGNFFINSRINSRNTIKGGFMVSNRFMNLEDSVYVKKYGKVINITDVSGSAWLLQPYFQWQHRISNDLVINTGVHHQYFMLNNTSSLEPRFGLKYNFSSSQSISLGLGRHSQIIPENIYFREVYDGSEYHRPNENLEMMKSDHLALAYNRSFNQFTRIKLETYYQKLFNAPVTGSRKDAYSMLNQGANFGVWSPDTLVNEGLGQNIGIELTLERFLNKGFYFLFTVSVFDSKYKASDGKWRSTAFNNNYIANFLAGYEIKIGVNSLSLNLNATSAGGQRYIPSTAVYDTQSDLYYRDFHFAESFSKQYPDYFRLDFNINFKRNSGKITQEWALEVTNMFNNKNIYNIGFNPKTGEEKKMYQLPMMIIPQWRIRF